MIIYDDRKLATTRTISEITPIDGADRIVRAVIDGWSVVVQKSEFAPGDRVVFFEIDTALPVASPVFAHLRDRGVKVHEGEKFHVLKTIRLKGVYSQGLAIPVREFENLVPGVQDLPDGTDVTKVLGLGKWETPVAPSGGSKTSEVSGAFLTEYARKTDSERVQNLVNVWDEVQAHDWYATEKVDGTSLTVARDADGELRVMSRNFELTKGDNVYWNAVESNRELFDVLAPGEVIQAEIAGPGIQKNPLGLPAVRVFVFDFLRDRTPLPRNDWPQIVLDWATPILEIPFPGTPEEALAQVEKLKTVVGAPGKQTEGVVWHTVDGSTLPALGDRSTWKAINNSFLQKHGG